MLTAAYSSIILLRSHKVATCYYCVPPQQQQLIVFTPHIVSYYYCVPLQQLIVFTPLILCPTNCLCIAQNCDSNRVALLLIFVITLLVSYILCD